jgi:hypothetical protein
MLVPVWMSLSGTEVEFPINEDVLMVAEPHELLAADFMHADNVLVAQLGGGSCLAKELFGFAGIKLAFAWNLDGDQAIQFLVTCLPHSPERADADQPCQPGGDNTSVSGTSDYRKDCEHGEILRGIRAGASGV